jgi:hypothetical protein
MSWCVAISTLSTYNNNPNVSREDTARNIVRDANKFTVEKAKAISQEVLNDFIEAWKHIFNVCRQGKQRQYRVVP